MFVSDILSQKGGLVFSVVFCILGGFLPSHKAAHMAPAQALVQQ